jgi:hypothetical protein
MNRHPADAAVRFAGGDQASPDSGALTLRIDRPSPRHTL